MSFLPLPKYDQMTVKVFPFSQLLFYSWPPAEWSLVVDPIISTLSLRATRRKTIARPEELNINHTEISKVYVIQF